MTLQDDAAKVREALCLCERCFPQVAAFDRILAQAEQVDALKSTAEWSTQLCIEGIEEAVYDNEWGSFDPDRDECCDNGKCGSCVAFPLVKLLYADRLAALDALDTKGASDE